LLATGAIHHALIRKGVRLRANIIVETATARDPHHFATLLAYGATAIYPYLSYQSIAGLIGSSGEDFYNATLKGIPLGKYGSGEDIAKTVAFLASPASGHTTGTNVVIDGGFTKGVQF